MREGIEYKNITLLPIKYEDTDNIVRWRNSKEVREKFLWQEELTKKQHEYWLKTQIDTGNAVQFIIKENISGKKIGTTFLKSIDNINRKAEFGIFIGEILEQGKGFGSNAIKAIISFGFELLLLNKIYLRVLESNIVAFKLYERIGFRLDGKLRDEVCIDGVFQEIYIMSILRREYNMKTLKEKYDIYELKVDNKLYEFDLNKPPNERNVCVAWYINKLGIRGEKVLEVGCGDGGLLYNLKEYFSELHGIDFASTRMKYCHDNLSRVNRKYSVIEGDFITHNYNKEEFDCVVSTDVIEHVPDIYAFFSKVYECLKPKGYFIFSTPNLLRIDRRIKLLFGVFPSSSSGNQGLDSPIEELYDGGHLHHFTFSVLKGISEKAGFKVVKKVGCGRLGHLYNIWPEGLSASCFFVVQK